ncbi:MAG: glycosyltransferase family 4 protein [Methylobacteriaceae bacterium]|nr:glycosyltransferase family 4 protein [Rhodoblastus sp.]MCC0003226.1 glycosyltransferase family 4 protein [Methylobacteriaceae bacterium]
MRGGAGEGVGQPRQASRPATPTLPLEGGGSVPLTIVICLDHASVTGGQAKVAFDSAIGLKAAGHRPIVFAAAGPVDPLLRDNGIEVVCLGQTDLLGASSKLKGAAQGIWNTGARRALANLLAGMPSDRTIVHVHGWAKALSPSIAPAIRASRLPAIFTLHDYFLFCPTGGFYDYNAHELCERKPLGAACLAANCDAVSYPRKIWRSARLAMANGLVGLRDVFSDFICISNVQRDIVAPYLPKNRRVHAISNPVGADDLGPKAEPASGEIVFVGRVSPEKGPLLFAEAARTIGMVPTFVGDGPAADELRQKYPEARVLGWQKPEDARQALRAARALVFPSRWYEGQPLTVLEAKAAGTPVIVSDVCAGREEIVDGETGLWFKSGDAGDLARALQVMQDDSVVRRMSNASYAAYWRDPPTLARHVARLEKAYRGMLAGAPQDIAESATGEAACVSP